MAETRLWEHAGHAGQSVTRELHDRVTFEYSQTVPQARDTWQALKTKIRMDNARRQKSLLYLCFAGLDVEGPRLWLGQPDLALTYFKRHPQVTRIPLRARFPDVSH